VLPFCGFYGSIEKRILRGMMFSGYQGDRDPVAGYLPDYRKLKLVPKKAIAKAINETPLENQPGEMEIRMEFTSWLIFENDQRLQQEYYLRLWRNQRKQRLKEILQNILLLVFVLGVGAISLEMTS